MAGLMAHLICGETAYKNLNEDSKNIIENHIEVYNIGTQGPDLFFFYLTSFLSKDTRDIGYLLHEEKVGTFIRSMATYANKLENEEDKEIAFSYISGYLAHYSLDANTHPYIYYNSGFHVRKSNKPNPIQVGYSLLHRKLETSIDKVLKATLHESSENDQKLWNKLKASDNEVVVLSQMLAYCINDVHAKEIKPVQVARALKFMFHMTRVLSFANKSNHKIGSFTNRLHLDDNDLKLIEEEQDKFGFDFLNLSHGTWHSPWTKDDEHETSFVDLYNKGVADSFEMMTALFEYKNDEINANELMQVVQNRSLKAGNDCNERVKFEHHDVVFKRKRVPQSH